jgi:hypothetical protein
VVQQKPSAEVFDPYTATSRDVSTLQSPDGEHREVTICTTSFTFRELKLLMEFSGFQVNAGYGCQAGKFERKPLALDDIEIMTVASKP